MAIFTQDRFDGGQLGRRGMYRGSSLKDTAVKRAVNVEPTDEGTLESRDLTRSLSYDRVNLVTRSRKAPKPTYDLDIEQPFLPGVRTLPFTWRGDRYVLHYTPYHYLSFQYDTEGFELSGSENPRAENMRTIEANITTLRDMLARTLEPGYLQSLEAGALRQITPLYNLLFKDVVSSGIIENATTTRHWAFLNWTRSTFLHNVYVVFREDGTVVRQGRPFHLRSIEPAEGEGITGPVVRRNMAGGGVPFLYPEYDIASDSFTAGLHEREATFFNYAHLYFGGMTEEEMIAEYGTIPGTDSPLVWSGAIYERYLTPNIEYEFVDLNDTFTFVDRMGTVAPDVVFGENGHQAHATYFPVQTWFGGGAGLPFDYDGRQEVTSPNQQLDLTTLQNSGVFDTIQQEQFALQRGPLLASSFGREKGEPTALNLSGEPTAPLPRSYFNPGHLTLFYGTRSQYREDVMGTETTVDKFESNTHDITIRFGDQYTGEPLNAEIFLANVAPTQRVNSVRASIAGASRDQVRVRSVSEGNYTVSEFRDLVSTDVHSIGLVARRRSPVYVDNSPRVQFPANIKNFNFAPNARTNQRTGFFQGAIPEGLRLIRYGVDTTADGFLGVGFHLVFTDDVPLSLLESFSRVLFQYTENGFDYAFYLRDPEVYTLLDRLNSNRENRPANFPTAIVPSTNFEQIRSTDRVLFFPVGPQDPRSDINRNRQVQQTSEHQAFRHMLGTAASPKVFSFDIFTADITEAFPLGRPYWSGYHIDEYAELQVEFNFGSTQNPPLSLYFPGVTMGEQEIAPYRRAPTAEGHTVNRLNNFVRNARTGTGPMDLTRAGFFLFDLAHVEEYSQMVRRPTIQVTEDGHTLNRLGLPHEVDFRFLERTGNDSPSQTTYQIDENRNGTPVFTYAVPRLAGQEPTRLVFWPRGLLINRLIARYTDAQLAIRQAFDRPEITWTGTLQHRIQYLNIAGNTNVGGNFGFPLRIVDERVLWERIDGYAEILSIPVSTVIPIDVIPYYSTSLLARDPIRQNTVVGVQDSYSGRICFRRRGFDIPPVPVTFFRSDVAGALPPVLDRNLNDFLPLLSERQTIPRTWILFQGRLFWFANRSFGASQQLNFGNFDATSSDLPSAPGDNLIPTGGGDTQILWASVIEGNLLVGQETQIRQISQQTPFDPDTLPSTFLRLPATDIPPIFVRNFLFKVRGDKKGVVMVTPTFQFGERLVATTISNPIALDYLESAEVAYLYEHPTKHGFYLGTTEDAVLYGHVERDGVVSWTEMHYPDRASPLLFSSLGIYYRANTGELRFVTGGTRTVETSLTCEIELLPLSLIGEPRSGRLNQGDHQADASVIVDMERGEALEIGRGGDVRTRMVYTGKEIREPYREGVEGDDGMLLRYTGANTFNLVRVTRQDNSLVDPRAIRFPREYRRAGTLGVREL